jgi:hypothetical protein
MYGTRGFGTKFNDSLSDEQKEIMCESSKERKNVFITGMGLGLLFSCLVFYLLNYESDDYNTPYSPQINKSSVYDEISSQPTYNDTYFQQPSPIENPNGYENPTRLGGDMGSFFSESAE